MFRMTHIGNPPAFRIDTAPEADRRGENQRLGISGLASNEYRSFPDAHAACLPKTGLPATALSTHSSSEP